MHFMLMFLNNNKGRNMPAIHEEDVEETTMPMTMQDIINPGSARHVPEFPDAPSGWSLESARREAERMGIRLGAEHLEAIRVIQGAYRDEPAPPLRRIHDALEARFADVGGMRHLYEIFSGGPVTRGCILAGVKPPAGAVDESFGSTA